MSEWLKQFENHQIHDDIRAAITPAEEIKLSSEALPADTVERIDRVVFILSELQRRLSLTDPQLIPLQTLNNLHTPLERITTQLSNFQSNQAIAHIQNAHNQLESVLVYLCQIPNPRTIDDVDAIKEAVTSLRRSAGQNMRHVGEEAQTALRNVQQLEQTVESLQSTVKQRNEEATTLLQNIEQQFEGDEKARQELFTAKEEERKVSSATLLSEKQEEWSEIVAAKQTEYDELYNTIHKKVENIETEFRNNTQAILDDMDERKKEAEKVVGVITDTGMVGGYQRIANQEKKSALFWRVGAFISLLVLVGFAITLFFVTLSKDFQVTPTLTLTRGFVALAVAILAGYAARQADKHERAQRKHRKMELELASIMPYLHEFPDEAAREIKTELAMKMFAQQEPITQKESRKTNHSIINLATLFAESIKSLAGK